MPNKREEEEGSLRGKHRKEGGGSRHGQQAQDKRSSAPQNYSSVCAIRLETLPQDYSYVCAIELELYTIESPQPRPRRTQAPSTLRPSAVKCRRISPWQLLLQLSSAPPPQLLSSVLPLPPQPSSALLLLSSVLPPPWHVQPLPQLPRLPPVLLLPLPWPPLP